MKDLVFVGVQSIAHRDALDMLKGIFQVDTIEPTAKALRARIQRETPDLILLTLGNDAVEESMMINLLNMDFINIPVVTLGTEYESLPYNKYYETTQFEKITTPFTKKGLLDVCCNMAGLDPDSYVVEFQKHILIVDDNALTLRNIKKMLDDKYSVAVAVSAVQAFTSIGRRKPDLILLDYAMPVTDGKKMYEMLQADVEYAKIPVVFLTSMADEHVVVELLSLKPAGYFLKPPKQEKLLETIEKII
ncbi:MAG: response regulator [Lachnospiraceae bacterium]|nr:response regulator [Lachnospiraceae bacterium]